MSTNKTPNKKLHVWEGIDRVLRFEFNENFHIIDSELKKLEDSDTTMKTSITNIENTLTTKSDTTHNHDTVYSPIGHNHDTTYSPINHNHNTVYSPIGHNHDNAYSLLGHNHDQYLEAGDYGLGGNAVNFVGGDVNTLSKTGLYAGYNLVNSPSNSVTGYISHMQYLDAGYAWQTFYSATNIKSFYTRKKIEGVWGSWTKIITSDDKKAEVYYVNANSTYSLASAFGNSDTMVTAYYKIGENASGQAIMRSINDNTNIVIEFNGSNWEIKNRGTTNVWVRVIAHNLV